MKEHTGRDSGIMDVVSGQISRLRSLTPTGARMLRAADAGGEPLAAKIFRLPASDLEAIRENTEVLDEITRLSVSSMAPREDVLYLASREAMAHTHLTGVLSELRNSRTVTSYTEKSGLVLVPFVVLFVYGEQLDTVEMILESLSVPLSRALLEKV